ncbi:MAG: tetratricopeptide repeat protein [Thermodesulfobacteriota bacterium]
MQPDHTPAISTIEPRDKKPLTFAAGALLLVLAGAIAYANTLSVPFVLDDIVNIVENTSIRNPAGIRDLIHPRGTGIVTRPLINLTLAANYALSGLDPISYHIFNTVVHCLCALVLFALLLLTFRSPRMVPSFGKHAYPLSFFTALFWVLHPANTMAVTYVIQRAESLMSLCYLLTLYLAARGFFSQENRALWHAGAIASFLLGIQAKEVIATAPLAVFLYDLTFAGGRLRTAFSRSLFLYLGFFLGLGLLFWQISSTLGAGVLASSKSNFFTRAEYLAGQPGALIRYLRLSVLPFGLTFDYWAHPAAAPGAAAVSVVVLLAVTVFGIFRRSPAAFAMACFFLILAPSSSILPLNTLMSEHRMYLPLAAILALLTGAAYRATLLLPGASGAKARIAAAVLAAIAAIGLETLTIARNRVYQSSKTLWQDTLEKAPENPRAHDCLGTIAQEEGKLPEAYLLFQEAVDLAPNVPYFNYNLANWYLARQEPEKAVSFYYRALDLWPGFHKARINLATALAMIGDYAGATKLYLTALAAEPGSAATRENLARILSDSTDDVDALLAVFGQVKGSPDLSLLVGTLLVNSGRWEAGFSYLARAKALAPDDRALADRLEAARKEVSSQAARGIAEAERRLSRNPGNPAPLLAMAQWYSAVGELDRAENALTRALAMSPDLADATNDLALVILKKARAGNEATRRQGMEKAAALLSAVLSRHPESLAAHYNMACVLAQENRPEDALQELEKAVAGGLSDPMLLLADPDLEPLADRPGYSALVRKAAARKKPKP